MSQSISIVFGTPRHGWLPVDFQYGDFKINFGASDVLNDPMEEFVDAIINISNGKTGEVTCWLEPFTYFFRFEKGANDYTLTIFEADDNEGERRVTRIIKGSYDQIIRPFKKPLIALCSRAYEEEHWPYNSFDKNKLKRLTADT